MPLIVVAVTEIDTFSWFVAKNARIPCMGAPTGNRKSSSAKSGKDYNYISEMWMKRGVSFMFRASCAMAKSEELENEISLQQQFRNLTNHDQAPEHTAYFTPFINKSVSMILYK